MAGISVNGNKKIATIQKEFNEQFPYLKIRIYKGSSVVSGSLTLAQARTKTGGGNISINGNKKIGSLEKEFMTNFGLRVQVCWTLKSGRTVESCCTDDYTLSRINNSCKTDSKKGVWR
jgi:hypothetical protein